MAVQLDRDTAIAVVSDVGEMMDQAKRRVRTRTSMGCIRRQTIEGFSQDH